MHTAQATNKISTDARAMHSVDTCAGVRHVERVQGVADVDACGEERTHECVFAGGSRLC